MKLHQQPSSWGTNMPLIDKILVLSQAFPPTPAYRQEYGVNFISLTVLYQVHGRNQEGYLGYQLRKPYRSS
jgi:hypothetical protein